MKIKLKNLYNVSLNQHKIHTIERATTKRLDRPCATTKTL